MVSKRNWNTNEAVFYTPLYKLSNPPRPTQILLTLANASATCIIFSMEKNVEAGCTTLLPLRSQRLSTKQMFGDMIPKGSAIAYYCAPPVQC